jgi:cyclase
MVAKRIVACLDVKGGRVVKGVRFADLRDAGEAVELACRYRDDGADEIVFYDIAASPEGRTVDAAWLREISRALDIPFAVAGGIRSVADAERVLAAGAEKVSVNTPALADPDLIDRLAARFGSQCVVVGVDSRRGAAGEFVVHRDSGDPAKLRSSGRSTLDWMAEVVARGAGEIVLNCMASDGVRRGYDIAQLSAVRGICSVPLVASGGAGAIAHFIAAFREAGVDAALAASVFHSGELPIPELKAALRAAGIEVRP